MANFTVVYDACLLYPASIRDLAVELARTGLLSGSCGPMGRYRHERRRRTEILRRAIEGSCVLFLREATF
jgi:hypothetical protein